jgi:hypothetical protein
MDGTNTASQEILSGGSKDIDPAKLGEMIALADFKMTDRIRARVNEIVHDPATAEKLKPWYSSMYKRPCFHDEYLQAFNQDNVSLIDTNAKGVERISENGVVANGGNILFIFLSIRLGSCPGIRWSVSLGLQSLEGVGRLLRRNSRMGRLHSMDYILGAFLTISCSRLLNQV